MSTLIYQLFNFLKTFLYKHKLPTKQSNISMLSTIGLFLNIRNMFYIYLNISVSLLSTIAVFTMFDKRNEHDQSFVSRVTLIIVYLPLQHNCLIILSFSNYSHILLLSSLIFARIIPIITLPLPTISSAFTMLLQ